MVFWNRRASGDSDIWFVKGDIATFKNVSDCRDAANAFVRSLSLAEACSM